MASSHRRAFGCRSDSRISTWCWRPHAWRTRRCRRRACCAIDSSRRSPRGAPSWTGPRSLWERPTTPDSRNRAKRFSGETRVTKYVGRIFALSLCMAAMLAAARPSHAIDFYEIEIYDTDTAPAGHLALELHSNTTSTATGQLAKRQMDVHQVHETLEASYGVVRWLEVGQYFATAKLSNGDYEYSGSRTKVHFSIPQTFEWPVQFGGNIELDYMRRAAEENPLSLELRPIAGASYKGFRLVANFAFDKPFSGP